MKKQKNKEQISKATILYIIGFGILLFGVVGSLIGRQELKDRTKTIGTIYDIEEKTVTLSNGTTKDEIIYHIAYNTLDGVQHRYSRSKNQFENHIERDMVFVYYLDISPENVVEKENKININTILMLLGGAIVLTNLSLMIFEKEQERKTKEQENLAKKENINFKVNTTMVSNINNDTTLKEAALIDDETAKIEEEHKNKSLLEKHLMNANKIENSYNANQYNNQLNTGSIIGNNVPRYGNNQVYGQNPNQGNYYGNNYYGNTSNNTNNMNYYNQQNN